MPMAEIHQFQSRRDGDTLSSAHRLLTTRAYAAQAAQAAFDLVDSLESRLSRFRTDSDIARIEIWSPAKRCV